MKYITLHNGVQMPMAGLGTYLLSPDEAEASCLCAFDNGCRLIDTANVYVNEKAVGRAMKRSNRKREDIFLETKIWPTFYEDETAVDKTLERLGTDYIDLLLVHQPAGNYLAGYRLIEKAYLEGKVRAIGLSNFTKEQVEEVLGICQVKPMLIQMETHPYYQQKEFKQFLKKHEMVVQAWYPLGHGNVGLLENPLFTKLAEKYQKTNVQIILRWHMQVGNVVIPGSKNPKHIQENFDVFDFELTDEEMEEIEKLDTQQPLHIRTKESYIRYANTHPDVDGQK